MPRANAVADLDAGERWIAAVGSWGAIGPEENSCGSGDAEGDEADKAEERLVGMRSCGEVRRG